MAKGDDDSSQGRRDQEKQQEPSRRSAITALVQDFEPIWLALLIK